MRGVVARLRGARRRAGYDAVGEGLHVVEGEVFVAHVCVGVGDGVEGRVDGAGEGGRSVVAWGGGGEVIFVVAVGAGDDDVEVFWGWGG